MSKKQQQDLQQPDHWNAAMLKDLRQLGAYKCSLKECGKWNDKDQ